MLLRFFMKESFKIFFSVEKLKQAKIIIANTDEQNSANFENKVEKRDR